MSTYVYMRLLESAPQRYDLGIKLLSLGRATELYETVAEEAVAGQAAPRVLEIGCGTGSLTLALLRRGAIVTAIDQSPDMLDVARKKLSELAERPELIEMTAVEIADRFPAGHFDAVASTLALSEMSADERAYVLAAALRVLRPGGRLAVGDEVRPEHLWQRLLHGVVRWPLALITYVFTQTTTWAVTDPAYLLREAGFRVLHEQRSGLGSMAVVVAEKPAAQEEEHHVAS